MRMPLHEQHVGAILREFNAPVFHIRLVQEDSMSRLCVVFVSLLWLSSAGISSLFANCYVLQNNTDFAQTWHFQYNTPISGGEITQLNMVAHGHYPPTGQWCWNSTGTFQATVTVDPGAYRVSWAGPFIMGDGNGFSPSGTYALNAPSVGEGSLIKSAQSPDVFFVQGGKRHHIPDPCTLQKRWSWSDVKTVPQNVVNSIPLGVPIPTSPGC